MNESNMTCRWINSQELREADQLSIKILFYQIVNTVYTELSKEIVKTETLIFAALTYEKISHFSFLQKQTVSLHSMNFPASCSSDPQDDGIIGHAMFA